MVIDGYILDIQPKQVRPTLALYFRKRHRPSLPSGSRVEIMLDLDGVCWHGTMNSTNPTNDPYVHNSLSRSDGFACPCTEVFLGLGLAEKAELEFEYSEPNRFRLMMPVTDKGRWRPGGAPHERAARTGALPIRPVSTVSTLPAQRIPAGAIFKSRVEQQAKIQDVWNSMSAEVWVQGLDDYWKFIKPSLLPLEREIQQLNLDAVRAMDAQQWYTFLLEKYFRWKYTAPNRYASTTKSLKQYNSPSLLPVLLRIKEGLFSMDKLDIKKCLAHACSIRGLGTAGASGLLAVLFPQQFGTVDQFAVKALRQISDLPEKALLAVMNPESLTLDDGVILVQIMRRKAADLNRLSSTNAWTPRKVDMVLWTYGHGY